MPVADGRSIGPLICVIEDQDPVRRAIERLAMLCGFPVRGYSSVEEFLTESATETPACLIVDLCLPGMNGLAMLEYLWGQGSHTPVIIMSALESDSARLRAIEAGAATFLSKPFTATALFEALSTALQRPVAPVTRVKVQS